MAAGITNASSAQHEEPTSEINKPKSGTDLACKF